MELVYRKRFKWNDPDLYGTREFLVTMVDRQIDMFDMMFEIQIMDKRFDAAEDNLPWDATASLTNSDDVVIPRIILDGNSEPSGRGWPCTVTLPKDVELEISIWKKPKETGRYFCQTGSSSSGRFGLWASPGDFRNGRVYFSKSEPSFVPWGEPVAEWPEFTLEELKPGVECLYMPVGQDQWKGLGWFAVDPESRNFKFGDKFEIEKVTINSDHTRLKFKGVDGEFNSVLFKKFL